MLAVVSPAKALDFESPLPTKKFTVPDMLDQTERLVAIMRGHSPDDIARLMSISPALAELNFERFQDWEAPTSPAMARPALLAFNGDTYVGLDAPNSFSERDFTHAQKVLRILSGLHGVLRPLDLILPYRLEMGSKVDHGGGVGLYSYWANRVTDRLNDDLAASPGAAVLVNLASSEYFRVVQVDRVEGRIVTPKFLDPDRAGDLKMISYFAKRARGAMGGWIIRERLTSARHLREFSELGYEFAPDQSTVTEPVFVRRAG